MLKLKNKYHVKLIHMIFIQSFADHILNFKSLLLDKYVVGFPASFSGFWLWN